jgi:putative nucleotidyltransferase with HDIG domain
MWAVNSAYYALETKMTRLDRAIAFMGMRAVKEVALSATVSTMCKPTPLGRYNTRDLWDHSLGVAILARELAVRSKTLDPEEAFLAGLLHDIALLLIAQSELENSRRLIATVESAPNPFISVEVAVFGFNHCQLGRRLAEKWQFPPHAASAIGWHHQPDQAPPEHQAICTHIYIADTLCCASNVGFPLTCVSQKITDEQMDRAQITRESADEIAAKLPVLRRLYAA